MKNGKFLWSGNSKHEYGVGMLLNQRAQNALMGYNPVSERVTCARFQGYTRNILAIVVYAPTTSHID
jgi:hypothetical protein